MVRSAFIGNASLLSMAPLGLFGYTRVYICIFCHYHWRRWLASRSLLLVARCRLGSAYEPALERTKEVER